MKNFFLKIILAFVFRQRVYVSNKKQTLPRLNLILQLGDEFILCKEEKIYNFVTYKVDIKRKDSLVTYIKQFLLSEVSDKINLNNSIKLTLVAQARNIEKDNKEAKTIIDDLYFKIDLTKYVKKEDIHPDLFLLNSEEIKLLQFKHLFNIFDYKMVIMSKKDRGVVIRT